MSAFFFSVFSCECQETKPETEYCVLNCVECACCGLSRDHVEITYLETFVAEDHFYSVYLTLNRKPLDSLDISTRLAYI